MKQKNRELSEEEKRWSLQFSYKLTEIGKAKGKYLPNLDKKTGLSRRHILRILKTDSNPSLHTICHLAKALGVEPYELLKFDASIEIERLPEYYYYKAFKKIPERKPKSK